MHIRSSNMSTVDRPTGERALQALASLRLTMLLLIVLAIVSIIGTIIPQGQLPPEYLAKIGGEQSTRFKLYSMLGFFDMYHAWWFQGLLAMLTVNLLTCTIKRLPHVWRLATRPEIILSSAQEKSATCSAELAVPAPDREQLIAAFSKAAGRPVVTEHDQELHLFTQRRPWARLAVYVVHASVILIFIGGIIGNVFGYKGFVAIVEGETVDSFRDRKGNERKLGFEIRCDQFTVTFYDAPGGGQSQMPKEFKSILTLTENGKEVPGYKHARVVVNDPLIYQGINFYQSSYGKTGSHTFRIGGTTLTVGSEETGHLPDGSSMHLLEAVQDVSPYLPGKTGPAAKIDVHPAKGGPAQTLIVFANYPEDNKAEAARAGLPVISYLGGSERMYTGLQVNKDPGVWVVWVGCILMCVGLYVAFFMPHQRIWGRFGNDRLVLAGHTTRGQAAFQQRFDEIVAQIKAALQKEI
jgi:cytochrome c biogenesis protein